MRRLLHAPMGMQRVWCARRGCASPYRWPRLDVLARRARARVETAPLPEAPPPAAESGRRAGQVLGSELCGEERAPEHILAGDAVKLLVAAQEAPQSLRVELGSCKLMRTARELAGAFAEANERKLEGLVVKDVRALYVPDDRKLWLKIKLVPPQGLEPTPFPCAVERPATDRVPVVTGLPG